MSVVCIRLVHCNSCGWKVNDFHVVSSYEKKVQKDICKVCDNEYGKESLEKNKYSHIFSIPNQFLAPRRKY